MAAKKKPTEAESLVYIANGTINVNGVEYHAGERIPDASPEDMAEAIKICLVYVEGGAA